MRLMQSNQKVTLYCQILPVLDANCSQIHLSKSLFCVFDPFFCTFSNHINHTPLRAQVSPFQFSSSTGHYTQLAWADTDRVGCGATTFRSGAWFSTLYTCNYGPAGNTVQGQMYRQGMLG